MSVMIHLQKKFGLKVHHSSETNPRPRPLHSNSPEIEVKSIYEDVRFLARNVSLSWRVTLCFLFLFCHSYSDQWTSSGRPLTHRRCSCWPGASLWTCTRCCSGAARKNERKKKKGQITWNSWLFEGRDKTKMPGKFSVGGILNLHCLQWFLSNNCIISDRGLVIITVLFQPYFTKKRKRWMMEVRQNSVHQAPVGLFSPSW